MRKFSYTCCDALISSTAIHACYLDRARVIFPPDLQILLQPTLPALPWAEILRRWCRCRFDPDACRGALEQLLVERQIGPEFFRPAAIRDGGLLVSEEVLYPARPRFELVFRRGDLEMSLPLEDDELAEA